MNRPLLISDCDEVLMHMVVPFGEWLDSEHDILFRLEDATFANALTYRATGNPVQSEDVWPLLDSFFREEMHRQYAVDGAAATLQKVAEFADIVILTNVGPDHQDARTTQLADVGMPYRVIGNRGPKGAALAQLVGEYNPSVTVFIDDLGFHHSSVAKEAPDVWRLHMVAEPVIAPKIPAAKAAHARIDTWSLAAPWLIDILSGGQTAPKSE